jgi:hypothetical protein
MGSMSMVWVGHSMETRPSLRILIEKPERKYHLRSLHIGRNIALKLILLLLKYGLLDPLTAFIIRAIVILTMEAEGTYET